MDFDKLMRDIQQRLEAHNVKLATELLELAWAEADTDVKCTEAHRAGNLIQREIFKQYELIEGMAS